MKCSPDVTAVNITRGSIAGTCVVDTSSQASSILDAMRKVSAALGSVVFFLVAPCVVVGLVPWLLTHWTVHGDGAGWTAIRVAGGVLLAGALVVLLHSFARFVTEGLGTPAPVAPTEHLV